MTRLVLVAAFVGVVTVSAADTDLEWRLYLASVAAADGALRSNETSAARHWLDEAPSRHRGWEWRYLRTRADESLQVVGAHDAVITGLAASPDGQWLATSSSRQDREGLGRAIGARVASLEGHGAPTWSPAFRPRSAAAGLDGIPWLGAPLGLAAGTELRRFEKLGNGMGAVAGASTGRCCAGRRGRSNRGVVWSAGFACGISPRITCCGRPKTA